MPNLTPVDESFLTTAPQIFTHTWEIAQPAEAVWAELTGDSPLHWVNGMKIHWTSPRPFGVDSTRTVNILGPVVRVDEHYFLWEEGRRKAFYGEAMNLPVFSRLAEDYRVEPRGPNACAYTWTVAVEAAPIARPGAALNRLVFGLAFRDTGRYFHAA